jgi:hypothetical protein
MDNAGFDDATGSIGGSSVEDAIELLKRRKEEDAARRRELACDEYRLVKREPKEIASAIAMGMVLMRLGLRTPDATRLDGMMSGSAMDLIARLQRASDALPTGSAGEVLVRAIDLHAAELEAEGIYAAWLRKAEAYFEEARSWLEVGVDFREHGDWRLKSMTPRQRDYLRATCAILQIDLPGDLRRGSAHDWLDRMGASLRYRGVRT